MQQIQHVLSYVTFLDYTHTHTHTELMLKLACKLQLSACLLRLTRELINRVLLSLMLVQMLICFLVLGFGEQTIMSSGPCVELLSLDSLT